MRAPHITPQRAIVLSVIAQNPGINTHQLDRIARTARGGHAWIYNLVHRARRAGLVSFGKSTNGRGRGLYLTQQAVEALQ